MDGFNSGPNGNDGWQSIITAISLTILFVAPTVQFGIGAAIVATDGNLVRETTGVIYDTDSGLEWYPGPDRGMHWEEALNWATGLDALGGGWRLPQRGELNALHRIGDGVSNLTPLVTIRGYWFWAGQSEDTSTRWLFRFSYGGEGWSGQAPPDGGRAMAVRIRQKHD